MKLFFSLFFCSFIGGIFAQTNVNFETKKHTFGKIPQGIPASYTFKFTNNTGMPLIIEKAEAECGCTKPEYPEAPIMKGKSNEIKVTYNAQNMGAFSKKITIKFAHTDVREVLTIEGEVIKKQP